MNLLNNSIETVENKWLRVLFNHAKVVFSNVYLPSHDHLHHIRVWTFCKRLIHTLHQSGHYILPETIEKAMIAIFFHDLGMAKTLDENHGLEGMRLCSEFFQSLYPLPVEGLEEILSAIEKHDRKSYRKDLTNIESDTTRILLNISDDLDAFGYIGIYRYAEIYLLRNIPEDQLSNSILDNLTIRYNHLRNEFQFLEEFLKYHTSRFEITRSFYDNLRKQSTQTDKPYSVKSGPAGVIQIIFQNLVYEQRSLQNLSEYAKSYYNDKYIRDYFTGLHKELDEFNPWNEDL